VLDLFDRQWTMIAVRTRRLPGPSSRNHIEHVLPSDERFFVHRESFRFDPFEAEAIVENGARSGQRARRLKRDDITGLTLGFFAA
jgi:hypothetical protein